MAIELHHLNTHGMMEQACDVLDGVVRLKERIAELEKLNHDLCERVTENDEIRLHWEEIEQTRSENERMKGRIAELEEERRWRKVDKKFPTDDDCYFFVLWEDGLPDVGYIGAEDDVIETVRDRGEGHSVEWWMPQPPKEEK